MDKNIIKITLPDNNEETKNKILKILKDEGVTEYEQISPSKSEKDMIFEISLFLNNLGIAPSIRGFHYLRTSILWTIKNSEVVINVTKTLYPSLAKEYNTTESKVERAMRHAITTVWKNGGDVTYRELVGFPVNQKPMNSQFIAAVAEYFKLKSN